MFLAHPLSNITVSAIGNITVTLCLDGERLHSHGHQCLPSSATSGKAPSTSFSTSSPNPGGGATAGISSSTGGAGGDGDVKGAPPSGDCAGEDGVFAYPPSS